MDAGHSLIRLNPQPNTHFISRGRLTLFTDRDGFLHDQGELGFFAYETRLLSRYRYLIDGVKPEPVALSAVSPHHWLGYYICVPPGIGTGPDDAGSGMMSPASEYTLELCLCRSMGNTLREQVHLTNFSRESTHFQLSLDLDADFADIQETRGKRQQQGKLNRIWQPGTEGGTLVFDYESVHTVEKQGKTDALRFHRWLTIQVHGAGIEPIWQDGRFVFDVMLPPGGSWDAGLEWIPGGSDLQDEVTDETVHQHERLTRQFLDEATTFFISEAETIAPVVIQTLERARRDLAALRLFDLDSGERAWTVAAGMPLYTAFYGRDALTTGWQGALLGPEIMTGTLDVLARLQGTVQEDWRDEQPGRMLHEAHPGPTKVLEYNPFARYYGSITTSAFYPVVLSGLWHWTGNRAVVEPCVEPALAALRWLDAHAARDGFYAYQTRSAQGVKHQAWKDSPDAIVDASGKPVEPPIATCEEQGFVYMAKLHLSEILWWLGRKNEAKILYRQAGALKQRFNEIFWMEDQGFYAVGLDATGRLIDSITSNPGHCLATAIVDTDRAETIARRMFEDDLFSGWGIRTLSYTNPAYNPYSYHRGSVWPVEQGTFAMAFMRYGLHELTARLAKAQFEAASLFDHFRLPEVFSGHSRTAERPFPAFYPQANMPQAWSSSAMFHLVQAMLGLYPYAPLKILFVDPHLPAWLPELTLQNLRVGAARISIHFYRNRDGSSSYRVKNRHGSLHVIRQPSPWSLTTGYRERSLDLFASLLPGR